MGQKINALGFRLKKRLNWDVSFCAQDLKTYSGVNFKNQQFEQTTKILFSKFHFFPNKTTINKNSKNYQIYTKLFQKKDIIQGSKNSVLEFQSNERVELLNQSKTLTKNLFFNSKLVNYVFSDYFYHKRAQLFKKVTNNIFLNMSPKIVHFYVANQLKKNCTLKRGPFTTNLNTGILVFIFNLLKRVQNHILGFKIVCSGKWKKTRSGRKQKLTIKFGQIVNSSVSNVILYDYSVQKTRFGSCSIKVWISHSKITN